MATSKPRRMTPTKNATPFALGTVLPKPIIDKIDRGLKALLVNYGELKNKLECSMIYSGGIWNFTLIHTDEKKPLVTTKAPSIGGMNKFLTECGRYVAKTYGEVETNVRKRA